MKEVVVKVVVGYRVGIHMVNRELIKPSEGCTNNYFDGCDVVSFVFDRRERCSAVEAIPFGDFDSNDGYHYIIGHQLPSQQAEGACKLIDIGAARMDNTDVCEAARIFQLITGRLPTDDEYGVWAVVDIE